MTKPFTPLDNARHRTALVQTFDPAPDKDESTVHHVLEAVFVVVLTAVAVAVILGLGAAAIALLVAFIGKVL
ncbi:hypothetical protein [Corynebacterium oculi]|uniref:Uncharacterized protein n=1 Tax=Corynebacterium oculi TaxID=1544416 RepID=A0A0Q0UE94_9CORY|nr:hypothetical protein [Corynebacterium oculi]KQB84950.1 hypothetical protein Cocul_00080 [Corynebacterium oculi]